MKEFTFDLPKEVRARHKLVAFTSLLALHDLRKGKKVSDARVVVHTPQKNSRSLLKALNEVGFNVIACCDSNSCRWNEKGLDYSNGEDQELDINPSDTYGFDADVFILDEISEYINEKDSESFKAGIIIETGEFITAKAKKALIARGVSVVPRKFFELYPLKSAQKKNVNAYSERMRSIWNNALTYAKKQKVSFEFALDRLLKERMV